MIELCPGEPPPAGAAATSGAAVEVPPEDDGASPPCPAPLLDSRRRRRERHVNHADLLNHARYPLRLFLVGGSLVELVLLGTLGGRTPRRGADWFAWTLKAYSGVTGALRPRAWRAVAHRQRPRVRCERGAVEDAATRRMVSQYF